MSDYNKPDYKVSTVCGLIGMILNIVYCMLVLSIVGVLAQFDTQHTATFLIVYLICLFIFLLLFYTGTYAIYAAYANKENRPIWLFILILIASVLILGGSLATSILNIIQCSKFLSAPRPASSNSTESYHTY